MNHIFFKIVGMASWLITALAALNLGLAPFGYNFFQMDYFMSHPEAVNPICYLVLASAVVSLALFVMAVMDSGCYCCSGSMSKRR